MADQINRSRRRRRCRHHRRCCCYHQLLLLIKCAVMTYITSSSKIMSRLLRSSFTIRWSFLLLLLLLVLSSSVLSISSHFFYSDLTVIITTTARLLLLVVIVSTCSLLLLSLLLPSTTSSSSLLVKFSKQLTNFMAALVLLTTTFATATCNLKTLSDPPWNNNNNGVPTVVVQAISDSNRQKIVSNENSGSRVDYQPGQAQQFVSSFLVTSNSGPPPTVPSSLTGFVAPPAVVSGFPTAAGSQHSLNRQRLLQLLNNPAFKRPNMDDLPVHVMLKLIPIKIQDLIEKSEVLETTLRLQLTWQDKRLSWNSELFHNITEVIIPGNLIWVPDIAILNSVSDLYHVVRDTRFEMKIESNGRIWWHPTGIVKTNCKLFLRYFPFDKQMCKFIFESPTFDLRFMNLTLRSEKSPVDTRMYTDGETWQLLGFTGKNIINQVGSKTYFSRVEFVIRIERARIYHLLNVILPAIFLSTVQVMFFLLPATHPQRVGSSTTTLLSVVVFQTTAVAQLPKTSTDIPLLSIYIFFVIIVSALSVGTSIIVAKFVVYADKSIEIPAWLARIPHPASCWHAVVCCLCCLCQRRLSIIRRNSTVDNNKNKDPATTKDQHHVTVATSPLLQSPLGYNTHIDMDPDQTFRLRLGESPTATLQARSTVVGAGASTSVEHYNLDVNINPLPTSTTASSPNNKSRPHYETRFLFTSWADISRFVDITLMMIAAAIAVLSPVALFIIMPSLAQEQRVFDNI